MPKPQKKSLAKKTKSTKAVKTVKTVKASPTKKAAPSPKKKSAAQTAPRRTATPKVSPLRGMSPDDWAKRLTGWQADALRAFRAIVTKHAPKATLAIKWGQPVWDHNGPFAWAKPAAKHFSVGFWRGADLEDPSGHLEGAGDRIRHVKITGETDLTKIPLEAFVKQAVALNEKKGDPTKR